MAKHMLYNSFGENNVNANMKLDPKLNLPEEAVELEEEGNIADIEKVD
jgi:hypothetical protein